MAGETGTSDAAYFAAVSRAFDADVVAATGDMDARAAGLADEAERVFKVWTARTSLAPDIATRLDADLQAAGRIQARCEAVIPLALGIARGDPRNTCIHAALVETDAGLTETDLSEVLDEIRRRTSRRTSTGLSMADRIRSIAEAFSRELHLAACRATRQAFVDATKTVARRAVHATAPSPALGIKASLVGVDAGFPGSHNSVDAAQRAVEHDLLGGLDHDLQKAGVDKYARSGIGDANIAEELATLNEEGQSGPTRDDRAREVASILRKYQIAARETVIRAGGWPEADDGRVARDIHDADRIRALRSGNLASDRFPSAATALQEWSQFVLDHAALDRTFGGLEGAKALLPGMWQELAQSELVDGEAASSAVPVIHWKSTADWLAYNRAYGVGTVVAAVVLDLRRYARTAGLVQIFGSDPRKAVDSDLAFWRIENRSALALRSCLGRLDGSALRSSQAISHARLTAFEHFQRLANADPGQYDAIEVLATKIAGLQHKGIPLLGRWKDILARALPPGEPDRALATELLRAGIEARIARLIGPFTSETIRPGLTSMIEHEAFQSTGRSPLTDGKRFELEVLLARRLGMLKRQPFDALPQDLQAVLAVSELDASSWNLLRSADWQRGGDDYFVPDLVDAIDPAALAAFAGARPVAEAREDLRQRILMCIQENGIQALVAPAATGTSWGRAAHVLSEIRSVSVGSLKATWAREIFGRDGRMGKLAGISELIFASVILGYLWTALQSLASGREAPDPAEPSTIAAALMFGGGSTIYSDFLFGSFARFGSSFDDMIQGPTFGDQNVGLPELRRLWMSGRWGMEQSFRVLAQNTESENVWLSSELLDFLIIHRIQDALHPDYLRRAESNLKLQNRAKGWLPPRPSRAERIA